MKIVVSIAGSDSSGGAGVQADIKTAEAFGVFCSNAITVLTAQNTTGVRSILPVTPVFLQEQLEMIFEDFNVDAIKIGMLLNCELIAVVKEFIKDKKIPIVLDPVFISKASSPLLEPSAIEELKGLFKYATLITPNQYEAKALFGEGLHVECECEVLIKDFNDSNTSTDTLYFRDKRVERFATPSLKTTSLHGSGCSLSTAIACNLALGYSLKDSIKISSNFIYNAIKHAPNIGHGKGPLNHKRGFDA